MTVHNQVRGLSPYPAAFTTFEDKEGRRFDAKIFLTALTGRDSGNSVPGEIVIDGKRMYIGASDSQVEILSLQPAGKKRMGTSAFLLGYHPVKAL